MALKPFQLQRCLAFPGYKAREDERTKKEGEKKEQNRGEEEENRKEGEKLKNREGRETKKREKNQRELTFNRQNVMPLLPSPSS